VEPCAACFVLLGAWGALIPFVGPYFDCAYTPDATWDYTTGRLYLEVLPGVATTVGAARAGQRKPGDGDVRQLFVLGIPVSQVWDIPTVGTPIGDTMRQLLEYLGFFGGLGVLTVFLAAFAWGRFAVVGASEADDAFVRQAEAETAAAEEEAATAPNTPTAQ